MLDLQVDLGTLVDIDLRYLHDLCASDALDRHNRGN